MATGAVPSRLTLAGCAFSDADKLEYEPDTDSARARLKYLLVESDDFANLDDWTEVDSGGNVNLVAGVVSFNGSGAWATNGISHTAGVSKASGYFEWKQQAISSWSAVTEIFGCGNVAGLVTTQLMGIQHTNALIKPRIGSTNAAAISVSAVADTWYAFRIYIDISGEETAELTIEGGVFTSETQIVKCALHTALGATIYWMFNRNTNNVARKAEIKEWRWYSGYATDNPTVTLADVDSGADDSVWDMSTVAFAGDTTNLTFKYACGNSASPTNWSAALTLAQLQAESDPTGRYFRLQIIVASDGSTQQEITEGTINCAVVAAVAPTVGQAITGVLRTRTGVR